jgi:hypothetical protein
MESEMTTAAGIIEDAEDRFRRLLTEAASEGNFGHVMQLAGWAQSLAQLRSDILKADPLAVKASDTTKSDKSPLSPEEASKPARKPKPAASYPKFFRNGELLVKIGWSKNQRAQYEQKAPFRVVGDLVTAISTVAARKGRFAMESILPLKSSIDGAEIPSYQAYLCLAWLRKEGLVLQHGRQGYSVKAKTDLPSLCKESLAALPEH